jgi:hypothetical protein
MGSHSDFSTGFSTHLDEATGIVERFAPGVTPGKKADDVAATNSRVEELIRASRLQGTSVTGFTGREPRKPHTSGELGKIRKEAYQWA